MKNTPQHIQKVDSYFIQKNTKQKSFYEIPYVGNNPQLMIAGFSSTPGVIFDADKQLFKAQTPVFDVTTNYKNSGSLYVFSTEIEYKANLCFKALKSSPSDYYCLSLRINQPTKKNKSLANDLTYSDKAWLIFKPNALFDHYHFKDTQGNDFSIYFTMDWLADFLNKSTAENRKTIQLFLDSKSDFLLSTNLTEIFKLEERKLKELFAIDKDSEAVLMEKIDFIFSNFILALQQEKITENHFEISNLNRLKILEAEKIIKGCVYKKFPTIQYLSEAIGISETKLKQHFKTLFGCTMFQYFQSLQMKEATNLLASHQYKIAEIAEKMGYQNSSKFSAAYKKETGMLPTQFLKI